MAQDDPRNLGIHEHIGAHFTRVRAARAHPAVLRRDLIAAVDGGLHARDVNSRRSDVNIQVRINLTRVQFLDERFHAFHRAVTLPVTAHDELPSPLHRRRRAPGRGRKVHHPGRCLYERAHEQHTHTQQRVSTKHTHAITITHRATHHALRAPPRLSRPFHDPRCYPQQPIGGRSATPSIDLTAFIESRRVGRRTTRARSVAIHVVVHAITALHHPRRSRAVSPRPESPIARPIASHLYARHEPISRVHASGVHAS